MSTAARHQQRLRFAAAGLLWGPLAVAATAQAPVRGMHDCPAPSQIERALAAASGSMQREQYGAAVGSLEPPPLRQCDARVALLLGAALEGSGRGAEAQQILAEAHRQWPANGSVAASLARSYWLSGNPTQAAEALASTHIAPGTPVQELELRAEVSLAVHQLVAAETAAAAAYHRQPSTEALLLLANILQAQGRAQDAVNLLSAKRDVYAASVPFLITIAESEFDTGTFAAAHTDLARALALDPRSYQAHDLLGNTLVQQQHLEAAVAEYEAAIAIAPGKPRTHYQLALAQVMQRDTEGALQSLRDAIAADEQYAPAYTELGELLVQEGRFAEAVEPLRKAIQYGPAQESPYYLLTRVYARLGDKQQSAAMLERYQEVKAANRKRPMKAEPNRAPNHAQAGDRSLLPVPPHTEEP